MNNLLSEKREKIRQKIRKDNLETIFKQKRILHCNTNSKYEELNKALSQNVENQSYKLVQNQALMNELINSNEESAAIVLANSCASESWNVINSLINDYKLHEYFMKKISENNGELIGITLKCYAGLANLLFSDPKLVSVVKKHLFEGQILKYIYASAKQVKQNEEKDWIGAILRLMIGLLLYVQTHLPQQDLIGIVEMAFTWIDIRFELSIYVIRLSTYLCSELLEFLNEKSFENLLLRIYQQNLPHQYIKLIDDLFTTSNEMLVISYLDNSKLYQALKYAFSTQNTDLIEASLVFLYNRVVNKKETIQKFVYQFYEDIIKILKQRLKQKEIEKCLLILFELQENELLNNEAETLMNILFEVLANQFACFDYSNCVHAARLILQIQVVQHFELQDQQIMQLEVMHQQQNGELSDLAQQIMEKQQ